MIDWRIAKIASSGIRGTRFRLRHATIRPSSTAACELASRALPRLRLALRRPSSSAAWPVRVRKTSSSVGRRSPTSSIRISGLAEPLDDLDELRSHRRGGDRDPPGVLVDRSRCRRARAARGARQRGRSWTTTSMRSPPTWDFSSSAVPRAMIRPSSTTAISSASSSASSRYCVVRSSVAPSRTCVRITSHMPSLPRGSRPGRRLVEKEHVRAADQRASEVEPAAHPAGVRLRDAVGGVLELEPLEQLVGLRCASGAREVVEPAEHPEVLASRQVLVHRRVLAGEADDLAHLLGLARTSKPGHARAARVGRSSVARMRTVVVLPAPFGPSRPRTVPSSTSRSTPSSARTSLLRER